jgi:hypothetical protein
MLAGSAGLRGHELITTKLTWSKEVSRIVYQRCAQCHRPEGAAFSLLRYEEARPWAKAIQEQVLQRKMPPWNAVKGFGAFLHDRGLSQEEIATISNWVEGGAPEGDATLLPVPPRVQEAPPVAKRAGLVVRGTSRVTAALRVGAVEPVGMAAGASAKLIAVLPGGERVPVIWIHEYSPKAAQRYELAEALRLPVGARLEVTGAPGAAFRLLATR